MVPKTANARFNLQFHPSNGTILEKVIRTLLRYCGNNAATLVKGSYKMNAKIYSMFSNLNMFSQKAAHSKLKLQVGEAFLIKFKESCQTVFFRKSF